MQLNNTKAEQAGLMARLRLQPSDADARLQLFRYSVIDGNWARAANQLDVASDLDPSLAHTAMVYRHNINCELARHAVMTGKENPVVLGPPAAWTGYLAKAIQIDDPKDRATLVYAALESANSVPGTVNGEPFEWLADADNSFGPLLEMFIDGNYYWVPFDVIEHIEIPMPEDMLDLAWCSCEITLTNGGTRNAFIPTRYPGTEATDNEDLKLARMTHWLPWAHELHAGAGQRMFVSDRDEYALLDCREVVFYHKEGHA